MVAPPAIYAIGIGFGSGSDSGDAARKATAECAQRSPNPDKCNSYDCRTGKCGTVAVAEKKPPYRGFNDSGGDSKAEAINEVMSLCQVTEQNPARWESVTGIRYPGCHLLEAACPDDGVTQVADAAGAASDSVSRYGVFAFDSATGAAGFSVWYPRQSSAEQRALSECAQHRRRIVRYTAGFPTVARPLQEQTNRAAGPVDMAMQTARPPLLTWPFPSAGAGAWACAIPMTARAANRDKLIRYAPAEAGQPGCCA